VGSIVDWSIGKVGRFKARITQSEMHTGWRRRRMLDMIELVGLQPGARIVDLGGQPEMWETVENEYHVTLVNLPEAIAPNARRPGFAYVAQDACDLKDTFDDRSFDFAFSNSTIEHVGDESRQEQFAREIRRLAPAYWVQTPSSRFPLEVHTWVPFYWQLPLPARNRLMRRWKRRLPRWSIMVEETRVLTLQRMKDLFPDARCYVERLLGLEKSYSLYVPLQRGSCSPTKPAP
jgi:hypothetical protein